MPWRIFGCWKSFCDNSCPRLFPSSCSRSTGRTPTSFTFYFPEIWINVVIYVTPFFWCKYFYSFTPSLKMRLQLNTLFMSGFDYSVEKRFLLVYYQNRRFQEKLFRRIAQSPWASAGYLYSSTSHWVTLFEVACFDSTIMWGSAWDQARTFTIWL